MSLTREKLAQAASIVARSGAAAWMTFVRETSGGGDPVVPLIVEGGLTWASALVVTASGRKIAVVGNFDADPLVASGDWDEVVPYVQGIGDALRCVLDRELPEGGQIAVNFSVDDVKADGLSVGMWRQLETILAGTRFEGAMVSAEAIVGELRGVKSAGEVARIRQAIAETTKLFDEIESMIRVGVTEKQVFDMVHGRMLDRGLGYAWDAAGDPIVNSGPDSMMGHSVPSPKIRMEAGHILHVDLGVVKRGYSSDLQRCWFLSNDGVLALEVEVALRAVLAAIDAGAAALKPGAVGHEVDAAARKRLVEAGFPEYLHALGHQVGRLAHDGGTILGPTWERYGALPHRAVKAGEIYTLELGVMVEGRGYLGLEEMVRVTDVGVEWLSEPQRAMPVIKV